MGVTREESISGLTRYQVRRPLSLEAFSGLIRRRVSAAESAVPHDLWGMGFVSRTGNVRNRNEDYGITFSHRNHQVMIVGDGLGGLSHGNLASFLAVEAASMVVTEHLREDMSDLDLQHICSKATWSASHQLAWMGDKLNVLQTGLRTTLILLIANKEHAALTYIGDGAVYHYKSPTSCPSVLAAHKAVPGNLSMLSASLGPTVHGKPRSRRITRTDSDLIVVMTDGLADRIETDRNTDTPPELISNLVRLAHVRGGNLQATAQEAVEMMVDEQDDKGYLCDDNISLGFIGNQQAPEIH